jgi:hypothetical protein
MLNPKVGDMVRLKPQKVSFVCDDESLFLDFTQSRSKTGFSFKEIEEILPRSLAVGDCVRSPTGQLKGSIKAIHDVFAWVWWDDAGLDTIKIDLLIYDGDGK